MKSFVAGICFLLAFIPAGNALACVQCKDRTQIDCTGDVLPCPANATFCKTSIVYAHYAGQQAAYHVFKNCSENHENYIYEEEIRGIDYTVKTKSCRKEGCNAKALSFPPRNTTLNGVKCSTCYVEAAFSCEPEQEPIQCTGDLTKCIYVAGTGRISDNPPFNCSYRGCTNIQDVQQFPHFPEDTLYNIQTLELTGSI